MWMCNCGLTAGNQLPRLVEQCDFVSITDKLFEELETFKTFKNDETLHDTSFIEINELLEYWIRYGVYMTITIIC